MNFTAYNVDYILQIWLPMKHKIYSFLIGLVKVLFSPRQSKKSYSQFGEDCALYQIFGGRKIGKGVYIDVGCHHPKKGNNTYFLYKKGWRGLLIDLELSKVYACKILRPFDTTILAAVSNKEELVDIYSPRAFSVMTTISKGASQNKNIIGSIQTKTLTSLIDNSEFSGKHIDLLSIDVEGVDYEVLEGLDFNKYSPTVIVIESWEKNVREILLGKINVFLESKGYELKNWVGLSLIYKKMIESQ